MNYRVLFKDGLRWRTTLIDYGLTAARTVATIHCLRDKSEALVIDGKGEIVYQFFYDKVDKTAKMM